MYWWCTDGVHLSTACVAWYMYWWCTDASVHLGEIARKVQCWVSHAITGGVGEATNTRLSFFKEVPFNNAHWFILCSCRKHAFLVKSQVKGGVQSSLSCSEAGHWGELSCTRPECVWLRWVSWRFSPWQKDSKTQSSNLMTMMMMTMMMMTMMARVVELGWKVLPGSRLALLRLPLDGSFHV